MTRCYVCGKKVLIFQAQSLYKCCHRQCFELAWKFLQQKKLGEKKDACIQDAQ